MRDYFKEALLSTSLQQLSQTLNEASSKCHQLQIFKNMTIHIEHASEDTSSNTGAVKVMVKVEERKAKFFVGSEWLSSNDLVGVN